MKGIINQTGVLPPCGGVSRIDRQAISGLKNTKRIRRNAHIGEKAKKSKGQRISGKENLGFFWVW
jgi:hypothetical protein